MNLLENETHLFPISLQDWWNLIVWDRPDLAHFLDCGFNYQFMEEFVEAVDRLQGMLSAAERA